MSNPAPPTLLELAAHSLLSSEASPIPALEEFTADLFSPLLRAAFAKAHKKALKALVQVWPFPFLRLGSLLVQWPNRESLQAVLGGLEAFPGLSPVRGLLDRSVGTEEVERCLEGESWRGGEGVLESARAMTGAA